MYIRDTLRLSLWIGELLRPSVSVIVPMLDEEKYLKRCMHSITRQQTSMDFDVIAAVAQKSTDMTEKIARRYADRVVMTERLGIGPARNSGARAARGDLFVFVDADTEIPANYLDAVHAVMKERGISGLSCAFHFDKGGRMLNAVQELSNKYLLLKGSYGRGEILGFNNAVRSDVFFKVGGFPDAPLEDGMLARKLHRVGRVVYLPEPVVVTSARRLESSGTFRAALYYSNLAIAANFPRSPFNTLLRYKRYVPIR